MESQIAKLINMISSKYSTQIKVNSKKSNIIVNFPIPLQLDNDYNYELGLQWFSVYNSIYNITELNVITISNSENTIVVKLEPGAYEVNHISERISSALNVKQVNESPVILSIDFATFKSILEIKKDYTVTFNSVTVRNMLGFQKKPLQRGKTLF